MDKTSSVEMHKLKKTVEYLEKKKGKGTELVSLYIPKDKQLYDVMSQMREEFSQAMNIKSTRTRKNVQGALEVIMQRLKLIKAVPDNGVLILVGTVPHGIKDKTEVYVIDPPEPIQTYVYHCDSQFLLEPIKNMLEEKGSFGLLLVDRAEATIGLLRGKRIDVIKKYDSTVPRKHGRGGQSQRRFERLIEIAAHEWFKKIGETASDLFLNIDDLQGVIIGGPGPTKEFFMKEEYLHHEIQKKILDIIDTSYTDEFGLRELVENASELFSELDISKEKKLVQKFLSEVVKDYGLAAYGKKEVMDMLNMGAVDTLLVSSEEETYAAQVSCSNCDYKDTRTVKQVDKLDDQLSGEKCPSCGEQGLGVDDFQSTLDELSELVGNTGAKVEVISTETEEGQQLKAFGGIAAILRFRAR